MKYLIFIISLLPVIFSCPPPAEKLPNGKITVLSVDKNAPQNGDQLRFKCNEGYTLLGSDRSVCNGKEWSSSEPMCVAVCPAPEEIANGHFKVLKTYFTNPVEGSDVVYTCNYYHVMEGASSLKCFKGEDGVMRWTGEKPNCRALSRCRDPGTPPDGDRVGTCCGEGSILTYSCDDGFLLDGDTSITCTRDGTWTNSRPRCKPPYFCPDPPNVENANIVGEKNGDYYIPGDEIEVVCREGSKMSGVGEDFLFCDEDGNWDSEFTTCEKVTCDLPVVPDHSHIREKDKMTTMTSFPYEFEINFVCESEYVLKGVRFSTCGQAGWSHTHTRETPTCVLIECPDPGTPENGFKHGNNFSVGSSVQFGCDSSFTLLGSPERVCRKNGRWSGVLARCDRPGDHCQNPGIPVGGTKVGISYNLGDKVKYNCLPGFMMLGSSERQCLEDRTWSGEETLCVGDKDFDETEDVSLRLQTILDTEELIVNELNKPEEEGNGSNPLKRAIDLNTDARLIFYFMFDSSGSVGSDNFKESINFAKALVERVGVSDHGTRVGALTFSSVAKREFIPAEYRTTEDVLEALDKIEFSKGGTFTSTAFDLLREEMIAHTNRWILETYGPTKIKSIVFFLSDGKTNMGGSPLDSVKILKYLGVEIYAIGITGDQNMNSLKNIATTEKEHLFILKDYDAIDAVNKVITGKVDYSVCGIGGGGLSSAPEGEDPVQRGIGGKIAQKPWPWMAALFEINSKREFPRLFCGGSVIKQKWILTAAHCVYDYVEPHGQKDPKFLRVNLGFTNTANLTSFGTQEKELKRILMHPLYNPLTIDYDIALIELSSNVEYGPLVRPICLPPPIDDIDSTILYQNNGMTFVTGWGYNKKIREEEVCSKKLRLGTVTNLKQLPMPLVNNLSCNQSLFTFRNEHPKISQQCQLYNNMFTDRMFCAGTKEGDIDACKGDSGGPMVQAINDTSGTPVWTQIGIVSWGLGCGIQGTYGYYTHVSKLVDWIYHEIDKY